MTKQCSNCKTSLPDNAKFCPECGAVVEMKTICPQCGEKNADTAKFCISCGYRFQQNAAAKKKQTTREARHRHRNQQKQTPAETALSGLSRTQSFTLLGVGIVALMVCGVFYYINFVETIEGKSANDAHQRLNQTTQPSSASTADDHTHAPSEQDLKNAEEQLKASPKDAELNVRMGNLLFDSSRFSEAIPYYKTALQISPNNPDVIVDLGVCYFNLKKYPEAQQQFELALKANPNHVNALYNIGVVAVQQGDVNHLIQYWTRLREIAPNSSQAIRAKQILEQIHENAGNSQEKSGTE